MRNAPLGSFARSLRANSDGFGAAIACAIALYVALTLALAVSPTTQQWLMRRFHLGSASFALWAAAQPSPWMYNFENRVLVAPRPLSRAELEAPPDGLRWEQVNHQVARRITFCDGRARELKEPGDHYFYLESRYRDQRVRSAFHVRVSEPPGPSAHPVHLTRMRAP
jgi:hypothetical protein